LFKGTKNTPKIIKIPGKFLEIYYDMNNPNKAFGAHEKDLEPSNKYKWLGQNENKIQKISENSRES
jgi:hypothetical protein